MKIMKIDRTKEELTEIIDWYTDYIDTYFSDIDMIEEIKWLIDNLKPNALQHIIDFYDDRNEEL